MAPPGIVIALQGKLETALNKSGTPPPAASLRMHQTPRHD
jgi:hypothetical protein